MAKKTNLAQYKEQKVNATIRHTKLDSRKNGDGLEEMVENKKQQDKKLKSLRVNSSTTIFVTKEKRTPEYAEEYRIKTGLRS